MTPLAMFFAALTLVMVAVIVIAVPWIAVGFVRDRRAKR